MPRLSQSTAALVIALGLLTALDGWLRVAEVTGSALPQTLGRPFLREALARRSAMQDRQAAAHERGRRAEELATAVMRGELTLHEGAARLRDVYLAAPDFPWEAVRRGFPGASDEECCCRMLIAGLRGLEGPDRETARAAALRLEAELDGERSGAPAVRSA